MSSRTARKCCVRLLTQLPLLVVVLTLSSTSFAKKPDSRTITQEEAELIEEGFRVFMEETFEGNGRTCGTCHVPSEQYTISAAFVATLSPADFDLLSVSTVPGLENPTLVEEVALFNTGGGDALFPVAGPDQPVFRATQQITALNVTTINFFGLDSPLGSHRLGWAGNGSPNGGAHHGNIDANADGTVRAFANGAIAQHMTADLARVAKSTACPLIDINDPDAECAEEYHFRFATDAELDAMDAFQRWLGRKPAPETPACSPNNRKNALCTKTYIEAMPPGGKGEFTLVAFDENVLASGPTKHELVFSDDVVEGGKAIFQSDEASCFLCHQNGGAHFGNNGRPHGNLERNQGIEFFTAGLSANTGVFIPQDPGNGATGGAQPRAMNVQSIIEAPRREHFGHNNAIGAYNGESFEAMAAEGFHKPFVRDLDADGCDGIGMVGTGSPGREGLVGSSNDNHADSEECLELVHGEDAANRIATFVRTLSAWYALRTFERLVAETCDRIDFGVSTELSVMEAGFMLDDVEFVLNGSQVNPKPHLDIADAMAALKADLIAAAGSENKNDLRSIHKTAYVMRKEIAKTDQEVEKFEACE